MQLFYRWMAKRLGIVPTHPVSIQRNIKVAMPDGAELLTDIYFGNPTSGMPIVLIRSPYGRSGAIAAGSAYPIASQGLIVVMQSCRGTSGSSGHFDPHHDELRDGLATIEWIKQQPWYDGSIVTFGMSYLGYTQWAIAAAAGPEVKAMFMQVTLSDFAQMTYAGNSFALETELSWAKMKIKMEKQKIPILNFLIAQLFGIKSIRDEQWRVLPLSSMDVNIIGERVQFWQDWMLHDSTDDPWWSPMNFRKSIDTIKRPISMVAGWFDIFTPWQMQDFTALQKAGCDARITIGPWGHFDNGLGRTGLRDILDWVGNNFRNKTIPPNKTPVKLYVMGANEWRDFDAWPPNESIIERWYLQPQKQLLNQLAPESEPDKYHYDPANPTPSIGGPSHLGEPFCVDNTALEARADVLTYTTESLSQFHDIIGVVVAELYISSSAQSADFFVRLCDVDKNGISKNICDGLQRVKIEDTNLPQQVRVELWPTAYRIAQGHRMRIQISSGAFPRWARNLGGAEPMASATELHCATQCIYHSDKYPSVIKLPLCMNSD